MIIKNYQLSIIKVHIKLYIMDYGSNVDLTIRDGKPVKRIYKVSGEKVTVECPKCMGKVIQYVEDTVYKCRVHGCVPKLCDNK